MSNTQTKKKKYKIIIKNYYKKMKFCRKFLYFFNISKYLFLRMNANKNSKSKIPNK